MNYDKAIDRGLEGVVACTTSISSIVASNLAYRGYRIEDLVSYSFEEVVFLLWNNKLPTSEELATFKKSLLAKITLDDSLVSQLKRLPTNCHPMSFLTTAVSIISLHADRNEDKLQSCYNLVAKMGMLVALFDRLRNSKDMIKPRLDKTIAWNFLYCISGKEPKDYMVDVFDKCLILHADHELNCSTFAARVTTSSLSDIYSAVTSAIGTLKGPLHGGANEQVMSMLKKIGSVSNARPWVEKALLNKERIMGFGHRVYKNGDPRAGVLKEMSRKLSEKSESVWFEISKEVEKIVKEKKRLLPNVDFYSATVYYSMGIPTDLYTPIFATSRVSGWLAHILEQYSNNRIYRPRGKYVGPTVRELGK